MKLIRVVGVGLITAAVFMNALAIPFYRYWEEQSLFSRWVAAMLALSESTAASGGYGLIAPLIFGTVCVGAGLLLSATVYTIVDDAMFWLVAKVADAIGGRRSLRQQPRSPK